MNDVPVLFYEALCSNLNGENMTSNCRNLSGRFGQVAIDVFDNAALRGVALRNGQFRDGGYFSHFKELDGNVVKFENVSRKYHWYTSVVVSNNRAEYSIDPAALEDLSAATKDKRVVLGLETSNVTKELAKWIGSMQFCFALDVDADLPRIPDSLIQKKTLILLQFIGDDQISDEVTNQLLQLMKQDQFCEAKISGLSESTLKKLIAEWRKSSAEMAGKIIFCEKQVTLDEELGFRKFTEGEERHFDVTYARWKGLRRNANSLIAKNGTEDEVYCFRFADGIYKSQFVFV